MIIYCITNKVNGKQYVGQTRQTLTARFREHKKRANSERHIKYILCLAMRKYGVDNFTIEVLEEVGNEDALNDREIYWINKINTIAPNGYNMTAGGGGTSGYQHTDEDRLMMSTLKWGMFQKEQNPFYGKTHSKEQKEKWRKQRAGRKLSEEHKKKISATRKRKSIINIDTGEVFESIRHACRHYGKDPDKGTASAISNVCKNNSSKHQTCMGYKFRYYDPNKHKQIDNLNIIKESI